MENYVSIMRRWHHMHHGKKYGLQDGVLIGKCSIYWFQIFILLRLFIADATKCWRYQLRLCD